MSIPTKAEANERFDEWRIAVDLLTALKDARQTAYVCLKKNPIYWSYYAACEHQYRELCVIMGVEYEKRFDSEEHKARRIAEGHPDYV